MRFTIYHGYALSLVLHAGLVLPLVMYGVAATPEEEPSKLVVVLQGVITETQTDEKKQKTAEEVPQEQPAPPQMEQAATPPPEEIPPEAPEADRELPPPPTQATQAAAEVSPKAEANVLREAQRIDDRQDEINRLREYVKDLGKKIQDGLPDEDRRATVVVSFAIQSDGQMRADTLKVVKSSGVARLDATALKTIRGSAPFVPPPREMTVTIDVGFDRKK